MDKFRFLIEAEKITVGDLIELENENLKMRFVRDFLAHFMVDDNGELMQEKQAKELINRLNVIELRSLVNQFAEEVAKLKENLIPEAISGS